MARYVEYDRIEAAEKYLNPAMGLLYCLPNGYERTDMLVPSLEAFIMILKQEKNRRWMAIWAPLIHMQTGFTVTEICKTYLENSRERDEIEGATTEAERISGTMFEQRDLEHVADATGLERCSIDDQIRRLLGSEDLFHGEPPPTPPLSPWFPAQE
jgi:hypothetical protein